MKRSASSIDKTVRPNGPVEAQRFFQSDQYSTSNCRPIRSDEACDQRAGLGIVKRIAAVAAFREQGASGAAEALDTLNDRVVHRGEQ